MKDVLDVIVTPQAPLGETIDAEEIEKKYRELPEE